MLAWITIIVGYVVAYVVFAAITTAIFSKVMTSKYAQMFHYNLQREYEIARMMDMEKWDHCLKRSHPILYSIVYIAIWPIALPYTFISGHCYVKKAISEFDKRTGL